jgi:Domain of unknown function (DUF5666)
MTDASNRPLVLRRRTALGAFAVALGVPTLLAACGGGGDGTDNSAAGATADSFSSGPISGLGSIIVGGVRFDDSGARVEDDEGGSRIRSELRLGMMVEVESSAIDDSNARASALRIRFGSELKGPVAAIDAAAQTLRVLDQTVAVSAQTVFDSTLVGGFGALAVGQVLEIHAQFDASTGRYAATRIEREDGATEYRLRGVVSQLDTGAKTLRIGDASIDYGSVAATELPAGLADGRRVRVRLQTAQVNGRWIATHVRTGVRRVDELRGVGDARIRGLVTAVASATRFELQGVTVDAASARLELGGAALAVGLLLEVRGQLDAGVLVAARVRAIERGGDDWQRVELHGTVSALDTAAQTFVVREVKVDYSRVVEWRDGSAPTLAEGRAVEVKGGWSADRRTLVAVRIEFE